MITTTPVFTAELSRELDLKTMQTYHLADDLLMEIAGAKSADFILGLNHKRVLLLIGPGNNGGDGWVIARHLALSSSVETVWILEPLLEKRNHLAQKNTDRIKPLIHSGKIKFIHNIGNCNPDCIVDSLFGTGLNKNIPENICALLESLNLKSALRISIDCPSGLNSTSGELLPISFNADYTLTFGGKKLGFFLNEAQKSTGKIILISLGFDLNLVNSPFEEFPDEIQPTQESNRIHKYDDGYVTIIAGSEGLSGAAYLAAKAAITAGAPAVELVYPKGLYPVFDMLLPEVLKIGIGEENDRFFNFEHVQEVKKHLGKGNRVVVLGPGMGRNTSTKKFIHSIIPFLPKRTLIDADAITLLADYPDKFNHSFVFTPHWGELATLSNTKIISDLQRIQVASKLATSKNQWIFSKGTFGVLCSPTGKTSFLPFSNAFFRKTGFGDVFAGFFAGKWLNQESIDTTFLETSLTLQQIAKNYSITELTPNKLI